MRCLPFLVLLSSLPADAGPKNRSQLKNRVEKFMGPSQARRFKAANGKLAHRFKNEERTEPTPPARNIEAVRVFLRSVLPSVDKFFSSTLTERQPLSPLGVISTAAPNPYYLLDYQMDTAVTSRVLVVPVESRSWMTRNDHVLRDALLHAKRMGYTHLLISDYMVLKAELLDALKVVEEYYVNQTD